MPDEGPFQLRAGKRSEILGISPREHELLLANDEMHEGALYAGAQGGGPAGGIQAGLRPFDRGKLAGAPLIVPEQEMAAKVLCSVRNWQVNTAYPGFHIPRSQQPLLHHPIGHGFVPGRTLNDGGWIDFYATGWYRRNGSSNGTLVSRVLFNGAYYGPSWTGGYNQGWGWWTQDPEDDGIENLVNWNWTFRLRVTSLGYAGAKDAADNTVFWRLEGDFEIWGGNYKFQANEDDPDNTGNDNDADKTLFRRKRRLIREHMGVVDPGRDLEVVLQMGNPRPSGTSTAAGDSMHVHGCDIVLWCPQHGREFGPTHMAAPKGVN